MSQVRSWVGVEDLGSGCHGYLFLFNLLETSNTAGLPPKLGNSQGRSSASALSTDSEGSEKPLLKKTLKKVKKKVRTSVRTSALGYEVDGCRVLLRYV